MKQTLSRFFPYVLIVTSLVVLWLSPLQIQSNFTDTLPKSVTDSEWEAGYQKLEQHLQKQVVFAVEASTQENSQLLTEFIQSLSTSNLFKNVIYNLEDSEKKSLFAFYESLKGQMLSTEDRSLLLSNQYEKIKNKRLAEVYSPFGMMPLGDLKSDPFGFHNRFLKDFASGQFAQDAEGRFKITQKKGKSYYIVRAIIKDNIDEKKLLKLYGDCKLRFTQNDQQFLALAAQLYLAKGNQLAMTEASVIGGLSLLLILLIFLYFFKNIKQLYYVIILISTSVLSALALFSLLQSNVHIISLIFSVSIIGLVVDYAIHLFAHNNDGSAVKKIFKPMTLALISTCIGYVLLYVSGLKVIQDTALFSVVGLVVGYVCVLFWSPLKNVQIKTTTNVKIDFIQKKHLWALLVILLGLPFVKFVDDVETLRPTLQQLYSDEQAMQSIFGISNESGYYLVKGASVDQLLLAEEKFKAPFEDPVVSLTSFLPSSQQRTQNWQLINDFTTSQSVFLKELQLGSVTSLQYNDLGQKHLDEFLKLEILSNYYLGKLNDGNYYSMLLAPLKEAVTSKQANFYDRLGDYSNYFKNLRQKVSLIYIIALLTIMCFLMLFMPIKKAVMVLMIPAVSVLFSLIVCSLIGPLNIFHTLAVILVFTLGLDYCLFFIFAEQKHTNSVRLSVFISVLTTLSGFAVLVFSSTPAIQSFGAMVFFGLCFVYLIAKTFLSEQA